MNANEGSLAILVVLWVIWAVIGLGLYVWYLAALASLFPRIGLPARDGWIPVWNESRILQRGGFSPWFVLLMFVPGVSVAFVVVRLIAIHRLHTELGKGAGLTVLALLVPPLWATMLSMQLRGAAPAQAQYSAQAQYDAQTQHGAQAQYEAQANFAGTGSVFASADQGYAPPAYPGADPAASQQAAYAAAQPTAYQQAAPPSPWAAPPAVPLNAGAGDAAAQGYAPPAAPAAEPFAPAFDELGFDSVQANDGAASPQSGAPAAAYGSPFTPAPPAGLPPVAGGPAFVPPAPDAPWGFGRETEEAYQQLSTQEVQPLVSPLTSEQAVEPFTWPGTIEDMPPAPRSAEPFEVPASAWSVPPAPAVTPDAQPVPVELPAPIEQAVPAAQPAPVVTPPAALDASDAVAQAADPVEEDLDRTVFVGRAQRERWVLELPDNSLLPLPSNDVIVGRRPSATGDSSVLVVPDSTRTLSKSHVRLHVIDGAWVVTDLGSTNGLAVIDETGEELVVEAGVSEPATEEMMFGTLRVRLRLVALED